MSIDGGGGSSTTYDSGYELWAMAERRTGSAGYADGQRQANYDYRFKVRYYPSATITTVNLVTFDGQDLIINGVERDREGNIDWLYLNCSFHGGT